MPFRVLEYLLAVFRLIPLHYFESSLTLISKAFSHQDLSVIEQNASTGLGIWAGDKPCANCIQSSIMTCWDANPSLLTTSGRQFCIRLLLLSFDFTQVFNAMCAFTVLKRVGCILSSKKPWEFWRDRSALRGWTHLQQNTSIFNEFCAVPTALVKVVRSNAIIARVTLLQVLWQTFSHLGLIERLVTVHGCKAWNYIRAVL